MWDARLARRLIMPLVVLPFLVLMLALILGPRLAERVRLPAMVGLVLAGMLVGPHATHILD